MIFGDECLYQIFQTVLLQLYNKDSDYMKFHDRLSSFRNQSFCFVMELESWEVYIFVCSHSLFGADLELEQHFHIKSASRNGTQNVTCHWICCPSWFFCSLAPAVLFLLIQFYRYWLPLIVCMELKFASYMYIDNLVFGSVSISELPSSHFLESLVLLLELWLRKLKGILLHWSVY